MSFLDKFKAVEVTAINKITESDKKFCENEEKQAKEALKQVKEWHDFFVKKSEEDSNEYFFITGTNYNYVGGSGIEKFENKYSDKMFTPLYDILHTRKLIEKIKSTFISRIERYFNSTYNLKLDISVSFFESKDISYMELVSSIVELLDGLSLTDTGIQLMKDEFMGTIYCKERYTLKGRTLSLNDYVRYESWNGVKISYTEREKQAKLRKAFIFFEKGELQDGLSVIDFSRRDNEGIDFTKEYFLGFSKIESVRFYKNGKMTIKFFTSELAEQFEKMFNLHTIESRW